MSIGLTSGEKVVQVSVFSDLVRADGESIHAGTVVFIVVNSIETGVNVIT